MQTNFITGLAVLCALLILPAVAEAETHWIWPHQGKSAAPETFYFRKTVELPKIKSATVTITADNVYELFINGQKVGTDGDWNTIESYDVTKLLKTGSNVIAVKATNTDAGFGGLAAELIAVTEDDKKIIAVTDTTWKYSASLKKDWNTAATDEAGWTAALDEGVLGVAEPWGNGAHANSGLVHHSRATPPPAPATAAHTDPGPFELRNGDRVVLIGATFLEREGIYGHIETALTARYADRDVIFRNLAWSGDTVFGHARSYFDPPEAGFNRLTKHLTEFKPTVAIICYGWSESWDGEKGLSAFLAGIERLVKVLDQSGTRIYLTSPPPDEPGIAPGKSAEHNKQLAAYRDALKQFAAAHACGFADFFVALGGVESKRQTPLTDNGVHMTESGYRTATPLIEKALGLPPADWAVAIDAAKASSTASGAALSDLVATSTGISFTVRDTVLPLTPGRVLKITGLKDAGQYTLKIDATTAVATATAAQWAAGVTIARGPEFDQAEHLRQMIIEKNACFFHRWRPANETYIFGFRRGEQGRNAVEMPQFDPLIAQKEAAIAKLRVPEPHHYELSLEEPEKVIQRSKLTLAFALALSAAAASLVSAAPKVGDIPDPDAELERQSFKLADGWEINLFASDPMLAKPIQMNFDPQGRLWVATSSTYPQIKPGQEASDKIIVLEDTKGVGRADKATVFADHLLIPTGLAPGDGGVYVANSTELLFLKDTDGDGKADATRIMLSGFGTEDTHHIIHTFRWGPDGMLYFNQSIYIHSHIETPWGVRRLMAGGIWQLRPETQQLEIFARGWVNAWGHQFDRWGQSFAVDGAGGEGINYVVPGAYYTTAYGASRTLQGLNPGQPKLCSDEILSGRHIPPDYVGSILTNDFRGHRIARFVLGDDGSGFTSRRVSDFLTTTHAAFRPVDLKMGPDGAIYIADFYNPIINHGEVDFRDPRRDTTHGRIWRVTYKGRPLVDRPALVGATVEQLLESLKAPEDWTRQQAKRVLKERGAKDVLPALAEWVKSLDPKDAEFDHQRLEALWVYQSLDVVEPELLKAVLGSQTPEARAAAVRVIAGWKDRVSDAVSLLTAAVSDAHPRVRLESVNSLRALGTGAAVEIAMNALDKPTDKFLEYSLWLTAKELQPVWLADFSAGKLTFDGNPAHITFALKATGNTAAVAPLVKLLKDGKIDAARRPEVIQVIASLGSADDAAVLLDIAMSDTSLRSVTLAALEQAALQRNLRPSGDSQRITSLFDPADPAAVAAARLSGFWKLETARPRLGELAGAAQTAPALRSAAIEGLALLGGPASVKSLTELTADSQPLPVRLAAIVGLAKLDVKLAAERTAEVLATLPADADCSAVFDAFIQRQDGPPALIEALKGKSLPAPIAAAGVRRAATAGRDLKTLTEALTAAGGLVQMNQHLTPEQMAQVVADVKEHGDANRGEAIFRRPASACNTCHAIAGAGGRVAPDLVSLGASAPVDYIVESLIEPSAKIKEGYAMTVVTTKDNQVLAGLLVRRSETDAVLRDIAGKDTTIPAGRIAKVDISPTSLMPPGLTATLRRDEFVDLVRFLSELGKEGAYQVGKAPVVRTWRTLIATSAAQSRMESKGTTIALGDDPALAWQSAYSTVAGILPLTDLPVLKRGDQQLAFARFQVEVSTAGPVTLQLGDAAGLEIWADGKSLKPAAETATDLSIGVHTITVAFDLAKRTAPLRIELAPGNGSTGKAAIVGGP